MKAKALSDILSVTSQISVEDVRFIKNRGFGTIICNRPDGEADGQPKADEIAEMAAELGLHFVDMPITSCNINDPRVAEFGSILADAKGPMLAYCRTGTRSATLWAMSQAGQQSTNEIISRAADAGYNLSKFAQQLDEIAKIKHEFMEG